MILPLFLPAVVTNPANPVPAERFPTFASIPQPTLNSETTFSKQCSASGGEGSAQADAPDFAPGGAYGARWSNWQQSFRTCVPWLMPSSDEDLAEILEYAQAHKYTVRPGGATGTQFAAVTDGTDENTIVVSLANYTAPSNWEYELNEPASTVRVNAGWSEFKLYSRIRPAGYTLPTQTALPIFQLGGMVANSVHGGVYEASFVSKNIKSLRVMTADGVIHHITSESELRMWRNSYGLLGIITAIEFALLSVSAFQVIYVSRSFPWSEANFWDFVVSDAMAGLQPPGAAAGSQSAFSGQFFMDMSTSPEQVSFGAVVTLMNGNATFPDVPSATPTVGEYAQLNTEGTEEPLQPDFSIQAPLFESIARWGQPSAADLPLNLPASVLTPETFGVIRRGLAENVGNDGFLGMNPTPRNIYYAAYFVPISNLSAALDVMRSDAVARSAAAASTPTFTWSFPFEMRFVRVTDDATLTIVPPGTYGVVEFLSPSTLGADPADNQDMMKAFYAMEKALMPLGAVPHVAKEWGFEADDSEYVTAFAAASVCNIYTDATKQAFNSYRLQLDPQGRFAGGGAMGLLAPCGVSD